MTTWSLISKGAWSHGYGASHTPADPGGYQAGDLLVIFDTITEGRTLTVPDGWTRLSPANNITQSQIIGKIAASSSESMPALSWEGVSVTYLGVAFAYRCGILPALNAIIHVSDDRGSTNVSDITCPNGLTITQNNCLVLYAGERHNAAVDAMPFNAINGMTNMTQESIYQDLALSHTFLIADWIQTTATNLPANNPGWRGQHNDGTQYTYASIIALLPGTDPQPGTGMLVRVERNMVG
jgi:hypothetical protein